ncbi:MAG: diguanylate cyclase [Intestinibacillus sp.]
MFEEDSKYKILIVEDGLLNQFVLRKILEDCYALEKALTAEEAMMKVFEFRPHLILLDIILPDANGFDVLVALKGMEETRNIPVIIITGLDSDEDEEKGFLLGAVDYIKKPFKNAIVRARVNTQIHIIRQMQTIERMGLIDALTGISNRRAFDNQIQHEWRRAIRQQSEISMMMLDIDKFKSYNDTYGHQQGDLMLQSTANALKASLRRSTDMLYRYGGEEFTVLLPDTGLEGALAVAEHMRENVEKMQVPCFDKKIVTSATVSIGVVSARPSETDQLTDFIERADRMLYQAKGDGRNQVWFERNGAYLRDSLS